jgi:hypothetical protein
MRSSRPPRKTHSWPWRPSGFKPLQPPRPDSVDRQDSPVVELDRLEPFRFSLGKRRRPVANPAPPSSQPLWRCESNSSCSWTSKSGQTSSSGGSQVVRTASLIRGSVSRFERALGRDITGVLTPRTSQFAQPARERALSARRDAGAGYESFFPTATHPHFPGLRRGAAPYRQARPWLCSDYPGTRLAITGRLSSAPSPAASSSRTRRRRSSARPSVRWRLTQV